MKLKQKMVIVAAFFTLGTGLTSVMLVLSLPVGTATAQEVCLDRNGQDIPCDQPGAQPHPETKDPNEEPPECEPGEPDCCGGVKTSIIGGDLCKGEGEEGGVIFGLLKSVLAVMTAGVGIAAVGGIAYGALLYTTAENKPDQTKKAIGIITNVVIGIVAYAAMYALLNFLIPGGVFS